MKNANVGFSTLSSSGNQPISRTLIAILAFVYALTLASLPFFAFKDRQNYLNYATYPEVILGLTYSANPIAVLFNEPLWLFTNITLSSFLSPEATVRTIIFVPAFMLSYLMFRASPRNWFWIIVFLLTPSVLTLNTTHLRQGYGVAIFLLGWININKLRGKLAILSAPFIHTSMFFVLAQIYLQYIMRKFRMSSNLQIVIYFIYILVISMSLSYIVLILGARQATVYDFVAGGVSGIGFIFWFFIFLLFMSENKSFIRKNLLQINGLILYLVTYFLVEVSARIFANFIPLILVAGLELHGIRRIMFLTSIVSFSIFHYSIKLI